MAETKVEDMSAATSVNAADWLYLIQSSTDKKLSITALLGNLPAVLTKFAGLVVLGGAIQSLVNSGTITAIGTLTVLNNDGSGGTLNIDDGAYTGQIKVLLFTGGSVASVLNTKLSVTSISFSQPGHSALLFWYSNAWWPLGGTATITV